MSIAEPLPPAAAPSDYPKVVPLDDLADPVGLYSHALVAPADTRLVTIAGQLAVDPDGEPIEGDFGAQFHKVIAQLDAVLGSLGTDLRAVQKFTSYLIDPDDIAAFYAERETIWHQWWPDRRPPANTLLVVQRLVRPEFRVEIEALAAVPVHLLAERGLA